MVANAYVDHKIEAQDMVIKDEGSAKLNKDFYANKEANAIEEIKNKERKVNAASERISRAQDELDAPLALPLIQETSYYEDLYAAQQLAPMTAVPKVGMVR